MPTKVKSTLGASISSQISMTDESFTDISYGHFVELNLLLVILRPIFEKVYVLPTCDTTDVRYAASATFKIVKLVKVLGRLEM